MNLLLARHVKSATQRYSKLIASNNVFFLKANSSLRKFSVSRHRGSIQPYLLADIGEGITECQILEWFVQPGDRVKQFDPICEVQSDKATVEITSRFEGVVTDLHYEVNDKAVVGKALLDIQVDDEEHDSARTLVQDGPQNSHSSQDVPDSNDINDNTANQSQIHGNALQKSRDNAVLMTPAVRHLVQGHGIPIERITGTGKDGRVLKEDVQRYILKESHSDHLLPSNGDKNVQLSPIERQMFDVMTKSLTIPHFGYTNTVDMTRTKQLLKQVNALPTVRQELKEEKLTMLPFIMKAISVSFSQFPKLNAHLDTGSHLAEPVLTLKASHDFGVAVETKHGLLVPVVRDVQNHSIVTLAAEIHRLVNLAKDGKLTPHDMKGATFTVSNIGSIGGHAVSPVIVAPMVAIVGIGRLEPSLILQNGKVIQQERCTLNWSADHRVMDGATIARCAEFTSETLANIDSLVAILK